MSEVVFKKGVDRRFRNIKLANSVKITPPKYPSGKSLSHTTRWEQFENLTHPTYNQLYAKVNDACDVTPAQWVVHVVATGLCRIHGDGSQTVRVPVPRGFLLQPINVKLLIRTTAVESTTTHGRNHCNPLHLSHSTAEVCAIKPTRWMGL